MTKFVHLRRNIILIIVKLILTECENIFIDGFRCCSNAVEAVRLQLQWVLLLNVT